MESPGKYLKGMRELRNLSLEEAAKSTKIREYFLRAIEEDNYEVLPSGFYVKGFIIVYAGYLGIDPNEVIPRYQNYLKSLAPAEPPKLQERIPSSKKKVSSRLFFIPFLAIILLLAFYLYTYYIPHKPRELVPPVPEEKQSSRIEEKVETQTIPQDIQRETLKSKEAEDENVLSIETPSFKVLDAGMGKGIEREGGRLILTGKCAEFPCNNQRVYFFTRIRTQKKGWVTHVWLWKGKEFYRKEMEVKPPAWSVYTCITLRPHHAGTWIALLMHGDKILASQSFKAIEPILSSREKQ